MVYWIDPLTDARWADFVERHPASSVFHTRAWLAALRRTYGYEPVVLTTSAPGEPLANGVPFCRIRSVLTGRRLVSLPFSDHCQPLAAPEELHLLLNAAVESVRRDRLKYVEIRPLGAYSPNGFGCSQTCAFHAVDLRPSLSEIWIQSHPDCIRRKIRRAGREALTSESGRSDAILDEFYFLQAITRRRHGLPPQPRRWFRNLLDEMGEKGTIRVARISGRAVAAILMLRHKRTEVYKYACSRLEDNPLGGMQMLMWDAINDAKSAGMEEMDLGRSDPPALGLIKFKERWGADAKEISYYRYPSTSRPSANLSMFRKFPAPVLTVIGRLLYRHMG